MPVPDTPPAPEPMSLIDEADRLRALQAVTEVDIAHNPSTNLWTFSLRPHQHAPEFEPFDRNEVPGSQINSVIREGWGVVARAAQLENAHQHEGWKRALEPTIPVAVDYEPGETHWVRTERDNQWASTQAFACWEIGPVTIQRENRVAHLTRIQDEYRLIFPDHQSAGVDALQAAAASPPAPTGPAELLMNPEVLATLSEEEKQNALAFQTEFLKRLQEIKNGEHLAMFLNYKTVVEAPKAWGFIASAPIFYYFYTLTQTNQQSTFLILAYGSAVLWVVKRVLAVIYNRISDLGRKPI